MLSAYREVGFYRGADPPFDRMTSSSILITGTRLPITGEISGRQRGDRWPAPGR